MAIVEPDRVVPDGTICRFNVEGDRHGSRNGWCVLFADARGAGGAFGHWRTGICGTWHTGHASLSAAERKHLSAAIAEAKRQHEAGRLNRANEAQLRAVELWHQAAVPLTEHPYMTRKRIKPHGIRQLNDKLVIPARDTNGKVWTLQFIYPDGEKRFLSGGRKRGCYFAIGDVGDELLIAEGYATGASLYESTGKPVAVAFDAGNLEPVAVALRTRFPTATITVCADNDVATEGNPGLTKATAAARAVGGKVAIPPAPFNDFNDLAVHA